MKETKFKRYPAAVYDNHWRVGYFSLYEIHNRAKSGSVDFQNIMKWILENFGEDA